MYVYTYMDMNIYIHTYINIHTQKHTYIYTDIEAMYKHTCI